MISFSAFRSAEAQVLAGGFSVQICLVPCSCWEKWKRKEVQGIYEGEGLNVSLLPTSVFCHGTWVARASRSAMFQFRF